MRTIIEKLLRAVVLGAIFVSLASEADAAPPTGATTPTNAGLSNAGTDSGINASVAGTPNVNAPNGSVPAFGTSINSNVGTGVAGVSQSGTPMNGFLPNGGVPNAPGLNGFGQSSFGQNGMAPNMAGANGAAAGQVNNPAINPSANLNANQFGQSVPLYYLSPPPASNGFGQPIHAAQEYGQHNSYWGRTFARGNPRYVGIRRLYSSGSNYFRSYRGQ